MNRIDIQWRLARLKEKGLFWIASHLPKSIRYWVIVHGFAVSTTGEYGDTVASELTVFEMQKRAFPE